MEPGQPTDTPMPRELLVGQQVVVPGRGTGTLAVENGDGTWNVDFDDSTEGNVPRECVQVPDPARHAWRVITDPRSEPKIDGWTRFVCFSDTHGKHRSIPSSHIVEGDVLLHAGDFSNTGEPQQVKDLAEWLAQYPAAHKVVIAGNHDVTFHADYYKRAWERYHRVQEDVEATRALLTGPSSPCIYLEDAATDVLGYQIYGSPWQPEFCDWAFNLEPGELAPKWAQIPRDVDILMTHGPPLGIGDKTFLGKRAGCDHLLSAVRQRPVTVHVAGHIHEGYGTVADGDVLFVNASTCTLK